MADSDNNQDGANSSAARTEEASQGASGIQHAFFLPLCQNNFHYVLYLHFTFTDANIFL